MGERYHRAQILLEPEQHDRMRHIASREDRSISDVAREVIEVGLEALAREEEARAKRRRLALDHLHEIREAAKARYGVYAGDLVEEARAERERQSEEVQQ